jgi:hypothetical protein
VTVALLHQDCVEEAFVYGGDTTPLVLLSILSYPDAYSEGVWIFSLAAVIFKTTHLRFPKSRAPGWLQARS